MADTTYGKYFDAVNAGNVFIGSTAAAGVVPPIYNNTAQTFGVWNPTGSGKLLIPLRVKVGLVTVGVVTSNFVLGYRTDAGAQVSTGNVISAATLVAPVNAKLGSGNTSVMKFAPATITTTAPSLLRTLALSNFMATTPAAANMFWPNMGEDFDGSLIVYPGSIIFVANNIAGVATYNISMDWAEVTI